MNVFVTDFIVGNVATHVQGFSSGNLIIFFEKLTVKCEGILINMWLPCTVNVYNIGYRCGFHRDFRLISLKCLNSQ